MTDSSDFIKETNANYEVQPQLNSKKKEWLQEIDQFYQQVRTWVSESETQGRLKVKNERKKIYEDGFGEYPVPVLVIQVNGCSIYLEPVGRMIVGAKGRIDMRSKTMQYRFVRLSEGWFFAKQKQPIEYEKLTQSLFVELLEGLCS